MLMIDRSDLTLLQKGMRPEATNRGLQSAAPAVANRTRGCPDPKSSFLNPFKETDMSVDESIHSRREALKCLPLAVPALSLPLHAASSRRSIWRGRHT